MKKILIALYYIIALSILSAACTGRKWDAQLAGQIESCTIEYPDSALNLLLSVRNPAELPAEIKAHHALLFTEAEYIAKRIVNDSALQIAYTYYNNHQHTKNEELRMRALIFQGVSLYNKQQPSEAMQLFLQINEKIDLLKHIYLKMIVKFYMGMIHTDNGIRDEANLLFQEEKNYALKTGKADWIINSDHHYAVSFLYLDQPDSALHYIQHSLAYLHQTDSSWIAMVYHNLGMTLQLHFPDSLSLVEDYILKSLYHGKKTKDSLRSYSLLTDFYYKTNQPRRADSLLSIIEQRTNDKQALYTAYIAATQYYKEQGVFDSAYVYCEKSAKVNNAILSDRQGKEIAAVKAQYEYERRAREDFKQYTLFFSVLSIIILILLGYLVSKKLKEKKILRKLFEHNNRIEELNTQLRQVNNDKKALTAEKATATTEHTFLENKLEELRANKKTLETEKEVLTSQYNHLKTELEKTSQKRNTQLSPKKQEELFSRKDIQETAASVLVHFYFPKQKEFNHIKAQALNYNFLIEGYNKLNAKFIEKLRDKVPSLTARELFICCLYHENYTEEEIMTVIKVADKGTFYAAKSRIKSKFSKEYNAIEDLTTFIKSL